MAAYGGLFGREGTQDVLKELYIFGEKGIFLSDTESLLRIIASLQVEQRFTFPYQKKKGTKIYFWGFG